MEQKTQQEHVTERQGVQGHHKILFQFEEITAIDSKSRYKLKEVIFSSPELCSG